MAPPSSSQRLALLALAAAAVALAALPAAHAHGFMSMPASRNYIHSTYYPRTAQEKSLIDESYWDYCPHCSAAGGPGAVSNLSKLNWPVGLNGLCGDKYYVDGAGPPVDTAREHEAGGRFATGAGARCKPLRAVAGWVGVITALPAPQHVSVPAPCATILPQLPHCTRSAATLAGEVGGTYEEGSVMEVRTHITAHHNGRFEFKICRIAAPAENQTWVDAEKAQLTQECFNQVGDR